MSQKNKKNKKKKKSVLETELFNIIHKSMKTLID